MLTTDMRWSNVSKGGRSGGGLRGIVTVAIGGRVRVRIKPRDGVYRRDYDDGESRVRFVRDRGCIEPLEVPLTGIRGNFGHPWESNYSVAYISTTPARLRTNAKSHTVCTIYWHRLSPSLPDMNYRAGERLLVVASNNVQHSLGTKQAKRFRVQARSPQLKAIDNYRHFVGDTLCP